MKFTKWMLLLLLACAMAAIPAAADTIYYQLASPNGDLTGHSGPYVQVEVTLTDATHATITFTSLTNGGDQYRLTDGASAAVNVHGTFTVDSMDGSSAAAGFTPGPYSLGNTGNSVDGWGLFNLQIDSKDSFTHSADQITFTIALVTGTWASATDVLIANEDGQIAAAHIGACPSPCTINSAFAVTGYAGDAHLAPEPSALVLLGSGLVGVGAFVRRRHFGRS